MGHSGLVIDATDFAKSHPGGQAVIRGLSGKDASAAFKEIGHSSHADTMVKNLVVGILHDFPVSEAGNSAVPTISEVAGLGNSTNPAAKTIVQD